MIEGMLEGLALGANIAGARVGFVTIIKRCIGALDFYESCRHAGVDPSEALEAL